MVPMTVHRKKDLDVAEPEPERLDACPDHRHRTVDTRVDQNIAIGGG